MKGINLEKAEPSCLLPQEGNYPYFQIDFGRKYRVTGLRLLTFNNMPIQNLDVRSTFQNTLSNFGVFFLFFVTLNLYGNVDASPGRYQFIFLRARPHASTGS